MYSQENYIGQNIVEGALGGLAADKAAQDKLIKNLKTIMSNPAIAPAIIDTLLEPICANPKTLPIISQYMVQPSLKKAKPIIITILVVVILMMVFNVAILLLMIFKRA